jgi:hypothetical protein
LFFFLHSLFLFQSRTGGFYVSLLPWLASDFCFITRWSLVCWICVVSFKKIKWLELVADENDYKLERKQADT